MNGLALCMWMATASPVHAEDSGARRGVLVSRLAELEARVAELEDRPETTPDRAVAQAGAVVVGAGEEVDDAVAVAGPVQVHGRVLGDAVAMGGDVTVFPGGEVLGDAVSFGGTIDVRQGGVVGGDRVTLGTQGSALHSALGAPVSAEPSLRHQAQGFFANMARRLAMFLTVAGAGVLVVGLWPAQVDQVASALRRHPLWYSVAGGILGGGFALLSLVLAMTIIGIPVSLALGVILTLAWMLGFVGMCKAFGERLPLADGGGGWVAFLVGAGLLAVVAVLPVVGPLFIALTALPAVGAALITRFGNRVDERW